MARACFAIRRGSAGFRVGFGASDSGSGCGCRALDLRVSAFQAFSGMLEFKVVALEESKLASLQGVITPWCLHSLLRTRQSLNARCSQQWAKASSSRRHLCVDSFFRKTKPQTHHQTLDTKRKNVNYKLKTYLDLNPLKP